MISSRRTDAKSLMPPFVCIHSTARSIAASTYLYVDENPPEYFHDADGHLRPAPFMYVRTFSGFGPPFLSFDPM